MISPIKQIPNQLRKLNFNMTQPALGCAELWKNKMILYDILIISIVYAHRIKTVLFSVLHSYRLFEEYITQICKLIFVDHFV